MEKFIVRARSLMNLIMLFTLSLGWLAISLNYEFESLISREIDTVKFSKLMAKLNEQRLLLRETAYREMPVMELLASEKSEIGFDDKREFSRSIESEIITIVGSVEDLEDFLKKIDDIVLDSSRAMEKFVEWELFKNDNALTQIYLKHLMLAAAEDLPKMVQQVPSSRFSTLNIDPLRFDKVFKQTLNELLGYRESEFRELRLISVDPEAAFDSLAKVKENLDPNVKIPILNQEMPSSSVLKIICFFLVCLMLALFSLVHATENFTRSKHYESGQGLDWIYLQSDIGFVMGSVWLLASPFLLLCYCIKVNSPDLLLLTGAWAIFITALFVINEIRTIRETVVQLSK